tara:strand:- start:106 stop:483 length:378 start_codon:yes stop_codon:yes gene_type:complete
MEPKTLLLVAAGGAIGAVVRYLVGLWLPSEPFPWTTLTVNLIGSMILGALACAAVSHQVISEDLMLFLGIGILGAFTTLSTYSVESIKLYQDAEWAALGGYVLATSIGGPILALLSWIGVDKILN